MKTIEKILQGNETLTTRLNQLFESHHEQLQEEIITEVNSLTDNEDDRELILEYLGEFIENVMSWPPSQNNSEFINAIANWF